MIGYVYILWHNREDDIFYVGSSVRPQRRLIEHRGLLGYSVGMSIIEEINFIEEADLLRCEIYWMHQFKQWGFNLINRNYYNSYPLSGQSPIKVHLSDSEFEYILKVQKEYREQGFKRITLGNTVFKIIEEHQEMTAKRPS